MKYNDPTFLGRAGAYLARCLKASMSVQRIKHPQFDATQPCIYTSWHGQILLPLVVARPMFSHSAAGLVSSSRDGEILASFLESFGFEVVRGSSSKKGISGMLQLLKKAKDGYSLGITPEGPRGPRYKISQGLKFLAAKSKLPIVPVGLYSSHYKELDSWDKFVIPRPLSKAVVYFGEPYRVDSFENDEEAVLKQKIFDASEKAALWGIGECFPADQTVPIVLKKKFWFFGGDPQTT